MWQVPLLDTNAARLRVTLYDAFGLLSFGDTGKFGISQTVGVEAFDTEPVGLHQNSPNPFSQGTKINFSIRQDSRVVVRIFDVKGQLVRLLSDKMTAAGSHGIFWDGRDGAGRAVSAGFYLYHLEASGLDQTRRMLKVGK